MPRTCLIDAIVLLCLSLYMLGGVALVPLHGDEATILYTARDFYYVFVQGDLRLVRYTDQPAALGPDAATEQELRLLNGSIARYLYGAAAYSGGYSLAALNGQWDWCCDLAYNQQTGRIPAPDLLLRARLVSTGLTVLAVLVLYGIGRQIGGRWVALLACVYFALNPAVLLNGRRAMMESSLLLGTLLALVAGLWLLRRLDRRAAGGTGLALVALGVAAGLALAAKHTAAFALAAIFGTVLLAIGWHGWQQRRIPGQQLAGLLLAAALAGGVFYALNPAWWGNPLARVGDVLALRTQLLSGQAAAFGGYPDLGAQVAGWLRQMLIVLPQYYEVTAWQDYIGAAIQAYEASPWHGVSIGGSAVGGGVLAVCLIAGIWHLLRARHLGLQRGLLLLWGAVMLVLTLLLTPLEWQRYYVPAYPAAALFAALGVVTISRALLRWRRARP